LSSLPISSPPPLRASKSKTSPCTLL
jgi:hypothetical protein